MHLIFRRRHCPTKRRHIQPHGDTFYFSQKNNLQEEQHKCHFFGQQRKTVPHGILEDVGMQRYTWKTP